MSIDVPSPEQLRARALPDEIDVDAEDFGDNLQAVIDGYRAVDYPARFEGLDSDVLFELEYGPDGSGTDCDAPRDYVEQLLAHLADWRARLLDGTRTDADAYRAALDSVREAWLQYSFRWVGGPELPYPFDLPRGAIA